MRYFPALLCFCAAVAPATGETYVVRPDGTGHFPTIQAAIDAVESGDVVELTGGLFEGDGNRGIIWTEKEITLRSQSGNPRDCILECERITRGMYLEDVGPGALIEGVTIRHGLEGYGAGISLLNSSPRIERCVFLDNEGTDGGGLLINGLSFPVVARCTFAGNSAWFGGGGLCI
jgi:hypothetical protein